MDSSLLKNIIMKNCGISKKWGPGSSTGRMLRRGLPLGGRYLKALVIVGVGAPY